MVHVYQVGKVLPALSPQGSLLARYNYRDDMFALNVHTVDSIISVSACQVLARVSMLFDAGREHVHTMSL